MKTLILYGSALVLFLVLDLFWLGFLARGLYRQQLGHLMAPQTNWPAALLFYFLFIGGLLYFAVWPGLRAGSGGLALLNGALYGLLTYATYELTNKAVIDRWPTLIVPVDILWGAFLCGIVSWLTFRLEHWWWH